MSLSFRWNVWSAAYGIIWSMLTKLPGARAFRTVIMAAVAVVTTPFFVAIIIATRQVIGVSSPGDVVLMLLVDDVVARLAARLMALVARAAHCQVRLTDCRSDVVMRKHTCCPCINENRTYRGKLSPMSMLCMHKHVKP